MPRHERLHFEPEDLEAGFYIVHELAALTRSSPETVYRNFEKGLIPGIKLGGRIIFSKRQIAAWLSAQSSGPAPMKHEGEGERS